MAMASENYTVLKAFRTEFNPDQFNEKIVHVLLKYDFIVGDFSDNHLRLKGFYHDKRRDVESTKKASKIDAYIKDSCNYMCPHYILEKIQLLPSYKKPKGKQYHNKKRTKKFQ
ncbi:MAG: YutD family protein [Defluviitaleaceae bacterium]|nr:YutD family protein [Defluviitaleaceae bacterium]